MTHDSQNTLAGRISALKGHTLPTRPLEKLHRAADGRMFELIKRTACYAIYSVSRDGAITGYEVFKVLIQRERASFGKLHAPMEIYARNEGFGPRAKSCVTLERAEAHYQSLIKYDKFLTTNTQTHEKAIHTINLKSKDTAA